MAFDDSKLIFVIMATMQRKFVSFCQNDEDDCKTDYR